MPIEVHCKIGTGVPDFVRVCVEGREDVEQMFGVHVFRSDPPRFFEPRLVRLKITQQPEPTEVLILSCTEEWGRPWILRSKIVSEGR